MERQKSPKRKEIYPTPIKRNLRKREHKARGNSGAGRDSSREKEKKINGGDIVVHKLIRDLPSEEEITQNYARVVVRVYKKEKLGISSDPSYLESQKTAKGGVKKRKHQIRTA